MDEKPAITPASKGDARSDIRNSLRTRPGYLLRRCLQDTSSRFEKSCKDTGITMRQYDYLFALGQIDVITQGELAQILGIDRSTNTLVIRILEKKRLVTRWTDPGDTRKKCLKLTDQGRAVLDTVRPRAEAAAREMLSALSKDQSDALMGALNAIIDRFDRPER